MTVTPRIKPGIQGTGGWVSPTDCLNSLGKGNSLAPAGIRTSNGPSRSYKKVKIIVNAARLVSVQFFSAQPTVFLPSCLPTHWAKLYQTVTSRRVLSNIRHLQPAVLNNIHHTFLCGPWSSFIHSFIYCVVSLPKSTERLPKPVLHTVPSNASSFKFQYLGFSLTSSSRSLHLLPRLRMKLTT